MKFRRYDYRVEHAIVYLVDVELGHSLVGRGREVVLLEGLLDQVEVADAVPTRQVANLLVARLLAVLVRRATCSVILAKDLDLLLILRFVSLLQCFGRLD